MRLWWLKLSACLKVHCSPWNCWSSSVINDWVKKKSPKYHFLISRTMARKLCNQWQCLKCIEYAPVSDLWHVCYDFIDLGCKDKSQCAHTVRTHKCSSNREVPSCRTTNYYRYSMCSFMSNAIKKPDDECVCSVVVLCS